MRTWPRWQSYLDDIFVKVGNQMHYFWRGVDCEGDLLEAYVSKTRDRQAALRFLRKAMKRYGRPKVIVTDKLSSYGAEMRVIGISDWPQSERWLNNWAENSLLPLRR